MIMQTGVNTLSRLLGAVGHAVQGWTTRRELEGLDERMLKDLGISRAQAVFELGHRPADWHELPWHIGPHHDA